jgi:hypothetical protein
MKRIVLPHSAIVKSPGLLPMLYTVREISEAIGVADRTLRDWLADSAPHFYDATGHIWIEGRDFADWILSMRKPKRDRRLEDDEAYCLRCNEVVELVNPTATAVRGNLIVYKGKCPKCLCTINRGGRLPNQYTNGNKREGARK